MKHFDIAVIGAGPAGANFARLADAEKYKILLIHNEEREKPCGGLLSPDAQRVFASYDLTLPSEILATPQIFAVRVIDLERGICRRYPRHYLNMNRAAFDAWLRSFIGKNVTAVNGRCTKLSEADGRFLIRMANGDLYTADRLVGADGASSLVRRTFFPGRKCRRYTAIQQHFEAAQSNPFYSCIYDEKTSPACSWILFKGNVMTFGGAFEPAHSREAFERQKQRLVSCGVLRADDVREPLKTEACEVLCPTAKDVLLGNERVFLIGEAAGLISPSSFEGISYALLSAEALAKALQSENTLAAYRRLTLGLRLKIAEKALKYGVLSAPLLRTCIMKSGITAIGAPPDSRDPYESRPPRKDTP